MTKKVLVTDYAWPSLEPERAVLARVGAELVVAPDGDEDTLTELARDVDGILTCWAQTTERVIRAAEKCVVVSRYGVGVDNIAVDTATELGIVVAYVPDYCVQEVANHAMALLLAWNRRIVEHVTMTKQTGWSSVKLGAPMPRLGGKKLGIIGFGRMGQALGKRAQAFDMEVLASGPRLKAEDAAAKGSQGGRPFGTAAGVGLRVPELPPEAGYGEYHRRGRACADEGDGVPGQHVARAADRRGRALRGADFGEDSWGRARPARRPVSAAGP